MPDASKGSLFRYSCQILFHENYQISSVRPLNITSADVFNISLEEKKTFNFFNNLPHLLSPLIHAFVWVGQLCKIRKTGRAIKFEKYCVQKTFYILLLRWGLKSLLKLSCNNRFRRAFIGCVCVFNVITLVWANQHNYFENATTCSKRTLKTRVWFRDMAMQVR